MPRMRQEPKTLPTTEIQIGSDDSGKPVFVNSEDMYVRGFNSNFPIWRYMDMVRLVSLLSKQAVWFSRVDMLDDAHELTYSFPELKGKDRETLMRVFLHSRQFAYVSSWHAGEYESMAMWEVYAAKHQGIAIKTSAADLYESLQKPEGHYGVADLVSYGDPIGPLTIPSLAFWKRRAYEYEREFRVLFVNKRESSRHAHEAGLHKSPVKGIYIPTNLKRLIKSVIVAPLAPAFLHEAVRAVMNSFGYPDIPVALSSLARDPFDVPEES